MGTNREQLRARFHVTVNDIELRIAVVVGKAVSDFFQPTVNISMA